MQLSQREIDLLIKIFRKYFLNVYKMIYMLDQKQADNFKNKNAYYYEQIHQEKHGKQHDHVNKDKEQKCCQSFYSKIYIPEKERSGIEQIVAESFRPFAIKESLPKVLEFLAKRFNNIKQSGSKDKLSWDTETEVYVLNEVLREGIQLYYAREVIIENNIFLKIKKLIQHEHFIDSKQQLLIATPQTWISKHPKIQLDFLSSDFISGLMKTGYGVMQQYFQNIEKIRQVYKELDFLEKDGRFEQSIQEETIRQDKTLWVTLSQVDEDQFQNLYYVIKMLTALPYEMNVKTQILAQISETFQISYFNEQRRQHKMHLDSSVDKLQDTGKKITILYFILGNENSNNYITIKDQKILIKSDMLIGLQSRNIAFQIDGDGSKFFIIRYWIDGPFDNKNNF